VIGCSRIRSYGPQGRDRKVEESLAEFTPEVKYHAPNAFDLKILALYSVCPGKVPHVPLNAPESYNSKQCVCLLG